MQGFAELSTLSSDSIKSLLKKAAVYLDDTSESSRLDAELLLAHCLQKPRSYLHAWPENTLKQEELDCFIQFIEKRKDDYPVAYMIGKKAFWTFELTVTPDVLIPRPETELLVETALDKIRGIENPKILDLGTGSGAIAIALASERKDATVFATDLSAEALAVAKQNTKDLGIRKLTFIQSDWFTDIEERDFDLIVSNPPYIEPNDAHLQRTIRHEPIAALVSENYGMKDIEKIIQSSRQFLKTGGCLMLEHGFDQFNETLQLLLRSNYTNEESKKDLNGNWRITFGKK